MYLLELKDSDFQTLAYRFYKKFRAAFSDAINPNAAIYKDNGFDKYFHPQEPLSITSGSIYDDGSSDDFVFKYENGYSLHLGSIVIEDKIRRKDGN